jgi:thiol-disulfide isomerase/thioredoxin
MKLMLGFFLACGLTMQAAAPVPRPAGDLKITLPSGAETLLASQKGKVVVIQFLYTWCSHCQATAGWLSKMHAELGPKGLQVYGVAFDDPQTTKDLKAAATMFGTTYAKFPVGLSPQSLVLKFLGMSVMDRYGVPQLAVIDKKGAIVAQTHPSPMKGEIIEEPVMRALVTKLLSEK